MHVVTPGAPRRVPARAVAADFKPRLDLLQRRAVDPQPRLDHAADSMGDAPGDGAHAFDELDNTGASGRLALNAAERPWRRFSFCTPVFATI